MLLYLGVILISCFAGDLFLVNDFLLDIFVLIWLEICLACLTLLHDLRVLFGLLVRCRLIGISVRVLLLRFKLLVVFENLFYVKLCAISKGGLSAKEDLFTIAGLCGLRVHFALRLIAAEIIIDLRLLYELIAYMYHAGGGGV